MTKLTLPAPREPAVDLRTGTFTRNWVRYLQQSFERLGGSDAESITAITALVRQILQDIADNEVELAFSADPAAVDEDSIEFSPAPVVIPDTQEPNDYQAQFAELKKQVYELQKQVALIPDPTAAIAEAVKNTRIVAAAQVTAGNVIGSQLIPWDAVNIQSGITYDATTRRFAVPTTGNYLITGSFFRLNAGGACRVLIGVNTDSPTQTSNAGHAYDSSTNYQCFSVSNIVSLRAGDYVTFLLASGVLYSATSDRFNFCTIQLIG